MADFSTIAPSQNGVYIAKEIWHIFLFLTTAPWQKLKVIKTNFLCSECFLVFL
jgi:hypothetical protein